MPDITKINALLTNKQNYVVYTGATPTWIQMGSYQPFIDTHCHIMSLNCTPMTLVWGFLYLRSIDTPIVTLEEKGKSRREVYRQRLSGIPLLYCLIIIMIPDVIIRI